MADNNDNPRSKLNSNDTTFSDEMLKLAQCLMPEPPTAKVKRMVADITDKGIDRQLHELGWKAYDTVVGAANNATNRAFTSPTVGQRARRRNRHHAAIPALQHARSPAHSSRRCGRQ